MKSLLAILILATAAQGAILPADRQITWRPGVKGGIPYRTTIWTNLDNTYTAAQINSAINDCPSNQVVKFAAGIYTFASSISIEKSGVSLRGAGPTNTIFKFTGSSDDGNITFGGTDFADPNTTEPSTVRSWTNGFSQFTNVISISNASTFAVGDMIALDQTEDNRLVTGYGNDGYCTYCGRASGVRSQVQIVEVTNVNGTLIGIDPYVYMTNHVAARNPQVWRLGGQVMRAGIEDIGTTNVSGTQYSIMFKNARDCWATNVYSYTSEVNHFRTYFAHRIEIRHCYCYGTLSAASQSYGVTWYWASDGLAEDNIFEKVTSPLLHGSASAGNVDAYNYATNQYYSVNPNWLIEGTGTHAAHHSFYLCEGNYIPNVYLDRIHGSGSHQVVMRNRLEGWEPGKTLNTFPIAVQATNANVSIIGNILGRDGYHDALACIYADCTTEAAIYTLGYENTGGNWPENYDSNTVATLIRHGNWDYFSDSQIWEESISDHDIPNGYFRTTKPSYFGILPFPPYNPASASTANRTNIPAGYRFVNGVDPPAESAAPNQRPPGLRRGIFRLQTTANSLPVDVAITNIPVEFTLQHSNNLTNWDDLMEVKFKTGQEWTGLLWDNTLADVGSRRFFRLREN